MLDKSDDRGSLANVRDSTTRMSDSTKRIAKAAPAGAAHLLRELRFVSNYQRDD